MHGDHRGRELGYPTANLDPHPTGVVPADGVYAGWLVRLELARRGRTDARLPAAVSIGTNPTFDGTQRRVEAYVLDRTDLDLYGERVAIELVGPAAPDGALRLGRRPARADGRRRQALPRGPRPREP